MKPVKLPCVCSGCKRSASKVGRLANCREWICPTHWRAVPKELKLVHRRRQRYARKLGLEINPTASERIWCACKAYATGARQRAVSIPADLREWLGLP